jgi:hypothetical protein
MLQAAESKHTAEYILANQADYEGKEVTLDVVCVQPVQWKSPIAELAFFHVFTHDRRDNQPGGHILAVIPAADSAKFAKKYGMDHKARNAVTNSLKGVFLTVPGRAGVLGAKRWIIDTTGQAQDLIKANKLRLPQNDGSEGLGAGPGKRGLR